MTDLVTFDSPKMKSSIIKVLGVGGGGTNAVNHMFSGGINGVDFVVCNTDAQSLHASPVPLKVQLGANITGTNGAGSNPEVGRNAALENIDDIREILEKNTQMLFITAGMGGGTGTGASPVIASLARELGILTVGIVTIPFAFEGRKRMQQAEGGIMELRKYVDTLLVISNEKLRQLHHNLALSQAFAKADDVLSTAAKGIAELITVPGYVNVDFEDVKTVMRNSGQAIMGTGIAEGEERAMRAVEEAIESPLLNDSDIQGASDILMNIVSGKEEIRMDEIDQITHHITKKAGANVNVIWGTGYNDALGDRISLTLIATGFPPKKSDMQQLPPKIVIGAINSNTVAETIPTPPAPIVEEAGIRIAEKPVEAPPMGFFSDTLPPASVNAQPASIELKTNPTEKPAEKGIPFEFERTRGDEGGRPVVPSSTRHQVTVQDATTLVEVNSEDRRKKLKEMSLKLKTPADATDMENKPAYLRRNVTLTEPPSSADSVIARFTLGEAEDSATELRTNNSFLHDNID